MDLEGIGGLFWSCALRAVASEAHFGHARHAQWHRRLVLVMLTTRSGIGGLFWSCPPRAMASEACFGHAHHAQWHRKLVLVMSAMRNGIGRLLERIL